MSTTVTQSGSGAATVAITVSRGPAGPAGPGGGDVSGPSSATNNNFAAFDQTTGKLIKDSGSNSASFAAASHTHVSADITDASLGGNTSSDNGKLAKFGNTGELRGSSSAVNGIGTFGAATDASGTGVRGFSSSGTGVSAQSNTGTNHARFGDSTTDNCSFIRRVLGLIGWNRGAYVQTLGSPATITADRAIVLPDASGTLALTSDITGTNSGTNTGDQDLSGLVAKSAYTPAHSILVQQSGTGSPTALSIGTNTLVGRLSGGGSDIDDLSASDVRTLLSINNVDNTSDATKNSATATLTNKTLSNPTVNNYTEGVVSIGNSGATKTIDLTSGTFQTMTMSEACTVTMPTATAGKSFVMKITTGTGAPTFTGVKWPDNTAPTFDTTASRYYFVTFQADGTAWSGQVSATYHV
jgi:hypothetical protein